MSEDFPLQLKQACDIYELLTARPDPEQEEKAQKDLLALFGTMKEIMASDSDVAPMLNEIHAKLSKWDTLERWFNEEKELKTAMENLFKKFELGQKPTTPPLVASTPTEAELKSSDIPTIEAPSAADTPASIPKIETSPSKPRLAPPVFKIPHVAAPKKKITPSTIQSEEKPENITPEEPSVAQSPEAAPTESPVEMPIAEEPPKVKISLPTKNVTPIKITPIKIEVGTAKSAEPEIRPVAAPSIRPVNMGSSSGPSIRPVNPQSTSTPSTPMIKPVSPGGPQIRPVSISPVSPSGPQIKPVSISPVSPTPTTPMIKPVSPGGMQIKPVGEIQKPMIKAIGGMQPVSAPQSQPSYPAPSPAGGARPVNLFDTSAKKPVNLFDQGPRKVSDENESGRQEFNGGQPLSKVSALDRLDYTAQNAGPVTSDEDEELLRMSKEEMYQELLRLEAKRFYTDKLLNEVTQRYQKQQINEAEYRGSKERFAFEIENLMKKISKIRNIILGIK